MNIREFSHNLEKIYQAMSAEFSSYQSSTGLACLPGCGRCCLNPEIEASALELIPMALAIYDEGKLDEWVEKLTNTERETCEAYIEGPRPGEGQCGRYHQRPSVCRMFGVAGYLNKRDQVTLSVCRYIKEHYGASESPADYGSSEIPMLVEWSYRMAAIDPDLIQRRQPINQALLGALQKVALYSSYQDI